MALPPLAGVAELADWLGEPIEADSPDGKRAEGVLRLASALVRRETGKTWVQPETNPPVLVDDLPDEVVLVTLAVAARGYSNPKNTTDVSEGIDDYNYREQTKVDEAGLYLTASERDLLAGLERREHRGLSTVGTYRGDVPEHDTDPRLLWPGIVNGPDPAPDEVY